MKSLILILVFLSAYGVSAAEFLIELNSETKKQDIALLEKRGAKVEPFLSFDINDEFGNYYSVSIDPSLIDKTLKGIKAKSVERNFKINSHSIRPGQALSSDFLSSYQYYLEVSDQRLFRDIDDIRSFEVEVSAEASIRPLELKKELEGKDVEEVVIAVIDTGLDLNHPEIKHAVFRNLAECDEEGNVLPAPTEDKDANGLVGDCQGWDFGTENKRFAHIVRDQVGHGTHISGLIAAKSNEDGIQGVGTNVKILPIQVFNTEKRSPFTFIDTVTKAVLYAIKMKADIINLSLGWPYTLTPNSFRRALSLAARNGVMVVSSAGNDRNREFIAPCALPGVICVGANGADGKLAPFSNQGLHVDLIAPGEDILSLYPVQATPNQFSINGYEVLSGTSQATPLISASLASLIQKFPEEKPDSLQARLMISGQNSLAIEESLSGVIKTTAASRLEKQPYIVPIVKDFQEVLVFGEQAVKFSMRFKNFWGKANRVQVFVESVSDNFLLRRTEFRFKDIKEGEIKEVALEGKLKSELAESLIRLKIVVLVDGKKHFERIHHTELLSVLQNDLIMENSKALELDPKEVLFFRGPELLTRLRSIPNFLDDSLEKSYWFPTDNGVKLISPLNDQLTVNEVTIEDFERVLTVEERDYNGDGKQDLLLRFVSKSKPEYIGYQYLTHQGESLATFKYFPEASVYALGSGGFIFHQTKAGQFALPVWVTSGKLPSADLSDDPWVSDSQSEEVTNRIYYLKPKSVDSDELEIRVIDNTNFQNDLRFEFGLTESTSFEFRQVEPQDKKRFGENRMSLLLGFERLDGSWASKELEFIGEKLSEVSESPLVVHQFYGQIAPLYQIKDGDYGVSSVLVSSQNDQVMISTRLDSGVDNVFSAPSNEKLIASMAQFQMEKENIQIVEGENDIYLFEGRDGAMELSKKISLNRVSFFGSSAFRSSFIPMVHGENGQVVPTIYQDSTFLGKRKIGLLKYNQERGDFLSTVESSIKIPGFCTSLNPIQGAEKAEFHMLCDLDGKLRVLRKKF